MYENIISLTVILLPAIIAWTIPKLRKSNGNWMISLKIVPLGIIALVLTDKAIRWLYRWRCEYLMANVNALDFEIRAVILFGSTALTMIIAGVIITRKLRTKTKFNPLPSILLFFPSLFAAAILSFLVSMLMFNPKTIKEEWHPVYLPQENGEGFVFESQSIHLFLAEYNYRLRFVRNKKSTYQMLFTNYGGKTHFNLYRLKDGRLLFSDKDWDYIVDTTKQQAFRLAPLKDKLYIAQIPNEEIHSWSGPYEKNGSIVMEFGEHTVTAEDATGILDGMVYYGCITDRFYSAAERAETKIESSVPDMGR